MDGEAPGALSQASQPWAPAEKTLSHMVPKVSPPPGVCGEGAPRGGVRWGGVLAAGTSP